MNTRSTSQPPRAFSRTELLVVLAVIATIAAVVLARMVQERDRARRTSCISSLHGIGMGFRLFATDTGGAYPFQFLSRPTNSLEFAFKPDNPAELWKLVQVAANDLGSPRYPICPGDPLRRPADSFNLFGVQTEFSHTNNRLNAMSYFLSIDADESDPNFIQLGDRYLTTDPESSSERGTKFLFGQQDFSAGAGLDKSVRWISTVHQGGGNVALTDGSVRRFTTANLREAIRNLPAERINRIWLPNTDATGQGNP